MKASHATQPSVMKFATGQSVFPNELDPARIKTMYEYEILENLYGNLLEYDGQGRLVADVPDSFDWDDRDLIFTFGTKAATRSGKLITAADASASIKRAILFEQTGHGDLRTLLCPNHHLSSIDDPCPGIRVTDDRLILTAVDESAKLHLMSRLESADFGIVPKSALGPDPANPVIVDHSETSGAYHLEFPSANAPALLRANERYHHYHPDMPAKVELVKLYSAHAVRALREGVIDYMPASVYLSGDEAKAVVDEHSPYNALLSLPFQVYLLRFSSQARRNFTAEQRFFVGGLVAQWVIAHRSTPSSSETIEFFPARGDGALTTAQRNQIERLRSNSIRPVFSRPIELSVNAAEYHGLAEFLKEYPEINVTTGGTPAFSRPRSEQPDAFIIQTDTAWTENINLLGHNFTVGLFEVENTDGDQWVRDYLTVHDRTARLERLRNLHFYTLERALIYPILVNSYLTVSTKAWVLPAKTSSTGPKLWEIRTQRHARRREV